MLSMINKTSCFHLSKQSQYSINTIIRNHNSKLIHFSNRNNQNNQNSNDIPPKEPINFHKQFSLPESNEKLMLERRNPHELDEKLVFEPKAHKYYYEGNEMDFSVTGLIEKFFSKFDADKMSKGMINGKNWPRPLYTFKDGRPYTVCLYGNSVK